MVGEAYPDRSTIEIPAITAGGEARRYDASELTSYPRLPWKLATFGSHTPLARTHAKDQYGDLVGRAVSDMPVLDQSAGWTARSDQLGLFENVRLGSGVIPALIQGGIEGAEAAKEPLHLAFALNGTIQVTTQTTAWGDMPHYFMALVPETAFREGRNDVEVFRIEQDDGKAVLSRISLPSRDTVSLERRGSTETTLQGWAADADAVVPAERVVVVVNGKQVFAGAPNAGRTDLVSVFCKETVLRSGFRLNVPKELLKGQSGAFRLFGIARGRASEIHVDRQLTRALGR
jgi:hypothetical protein